MSDEGASSIEYSPIDSDFRTARLVELSRKSMELFAARKQKQWDQKWKNFEIETWRWDIPECVITFRSELEPADVHRQVQRLRLWGSRDSGPNWMLRSVRIFVAGSHERDPSLEMEINAWIDIRDNRYGVVRVWRHQEDGRIKGKQLLESDSGRAILDCADLLEAGYQAVFSWGPSDLEQGDSLGVNGVRDLQNRRGHDF